VVALGEHVFLQRVEESMKGLWSVQALKLEERAWTRIELISKNSWDNARFLALKEALWRAM
jgi:hypothetical protein